MQNTKRLKAIGNKLLLLIELPFYPLLYAYLSFMLATPERRRWIYTSTKYYVPLRRLHFYILDKMFEKEVENYTIPSYDKERAGFILDLKHLVAHRFFIRHAFNSNYNYTLKRVKEIFEKLNNQITHVIDIGSGSGVLTKAIKDIVPKHVGVVGSEIRKETIAYNKELYPQITWIHMSELHESVQKASPQKVLFVVNGVINFMSEQELQALLAHAPQEIVWFYHTPTTDMSLVLNSDQKIISSKAGYVDYNLPLYAKEFGYDFNFEYVPLAGNGGFVSATSKRV